MGKVATFFSSQGIALPQEQKRQMLTLDREIEDMETQVQSLQAENLHLKAQVNPLERDIKRLTDQIDNLKRDSTHNQGNELDESAITLLHAIAESGRFPEDIGASTLRTSDAKARFYMSLLQERDFVVQVSYSPLSYGPTPDGLKYLHKIGKL